MSGLPRSPEIDRALALAQSVHAGQTRKGARGEAYIHHVTEVATILNEATSGKDQVLIIGGLLHDVIEDSDLTLADLDRDFGAEVSQLVAEVTDPEGVTEEARRRHQVEAAPGLSARARMLKIADKTSNIEEMAADPPPGWSLAEIQAYIRWGVDVVAGCRGLNAQLEDRFDAALAAAHARFGDGAPD
ncbi:MAG: HD domain-containing protein [Alphaproteobacteria bacterium]|nr:HD domain-containing protein [Alphaproteobacteria bacterium]